MKQMKYKKQIQLIAAIVTLIVFPVITFYLMEAYTHNPFEEVRPWAQFFNILLFELLAWIFVSVTGKIQSGLRIELVIAMIYGIANAYVVRFRTNPIAGACACCHQQSAGDLLRRNDRCSCGEGNIRKHFALP